MMIEVAVTTLKQPSRRESQAMTAIVTISCVKVYLDKSFFSTFYYLFTKYLTYSKARVGSQVHRASTKGKLQNYAKRNGGPGRQHSCTAAS
jgi:hypothetical protein